MAQQQPNPSSPPEQPSYSAVGAPAGPAGASFAAPAGPAGASFAPVGAGGGAPGHAAPGHAAPGRARPWSRRKIALIATLGFALAAAAGAFTAVAVTGGGGPQAGPVVGDPLRYPVVTTPGSGASDAADDESLHPVTQPTADDAVLGATGAPDGAAAGGGTALDDGAAPPAATPATPATPAAPAATSAATQFITAEQVKQIALAQAPGATSISLEFDRHKNHAKYEGTMIHGWIVYEFEIDAVTGAILKWKVDEID